MSPLRRETPEAAGPKKTGETPFRKFPPFGVICPGLSPALIQMPFAKADPSKEHGKRDGENTAALREDAFFPCKAALLGKSRFYSGRCKEG